MSWMLRLRITRTHKTFEDDATLVAMWHCCAATFESMQVQQFSKGAEVTSVRAGYRQVIDVLAIVVENGFRRLTADQTFSSPLAA
jgi:hypothetical protein